MTYGHIRLPQSQCAFHAVYLRFKLHTRREESRDYVFHCMQVGRRIPMKKNIADLQIIGVMSVVSRLCVCVSQLRSTAIPQGIIHAMSQAKAQGVVDD